MTRDQAAAAASVFAAKEHIDAGDWDAYLVTLRTAIDARIRTAEFKADVLRRAEFRADLTPEYVEHCDATTTRPEYL